MAIAICPKCRAEFLAAERADRPEVCPGCGATFIFSLGGSPETPAPAQPAVSAAGVFGVTLAILLGLIIDALLAFGSIWHVIEARRPGQADVHAPVPPMLLLLAGLLGHALFSLLAVGPMGSEPRRSVLFGRIAVGCWLVFGSIGVFTGAHLWPASLGGSPERVVALSLLLLGALLTYLGGLEWLSKKADRT